MRPTLSIHGYLTILVIAVILPFLGFTTLVVDHAGQWRARTSRPHGTRSSYRDGR